ncbi:hypothetical protein [Eubacterium sp. 1001713B170207_170306_E7]|uniref:hypothetical protein n=1 Tax=Eubacterium sp. 1001713B170207_170306_E7 TaxID=2787097 RepID=UPI00189A9E6B|nr:hypothetical protein [Eubacterium sp. 1001713B170207_170306_E7]
MRAVPAGRFLLPQVKDFVSRVSLVVKFSILHFPFAKMPPVLRFMCVMTFWCAQSLCSCGFQRFFITQAGLSEKGVMCFWDAEARGALLWESIIP